MSKIPTLQFLKDVLICSLGAFGGPEAHYGVFLDQMVQKKNYVTEEEMIELIALCGVLPGPSSTQTMVSIGYKVGGMKLAWLTLLVWALPAMAIMTLFSFVYQLFDFSDTFQNGIRYLGPMAVGFIVAAAFGIGKKVVKDKLTFFLLIIGALVTYFYRSPWIFPAILILGGVISTFVSNEKQIFNHVKLNPPWKYLIAFFVFAIGSVLLAMVWDNHIFYLFESFYRYGYLVFGGGQVVIAVMYSDLVELHKFMTSEQFLAGYGLVQGMPGPMFSFASYVGGLASTEKGALYQIFAAFASGVGIFFPGTLLIFFVYPIWENLKKVKAVKLSLKGINAIAGGLIVSAAILLLQKNGLAFDNLIVTVMTIILILSKKIPIPLLVGLTIVAGFVLG
jgi:chromate transporter